jgi:hypothetical protein
MSQYITKLQLLLNTDNVGKSSTNDGLAGQEGLQGWKTLD